MDKLQYHHTPLCVYHVYHIYLASYIRAQNRDNVTLLRQ
jgi:hypothetical protein